MPVCEGCGASYENSFKFCPHCGRSKPESALIVEDVNQVKGAVERTNAELEIARLRQEIKELESARSSRSSENYFGMGAAGAAGVALSFGFFGSDVNGIGAIFLIGGGLLLLAALLSSIDKSKILNKIRSQIAEREAKIRENLKILQ